ncbi:MAG TPA: NAD(+) synthase [Anaeromyxobacteraceae bacterium]|nr:NAD(+) synthase [Anaeromyxobacteraceae bacterium]
MNSVLQLDPAAECARIEVAVREQVMQGLRRKGVVVGISGGVDSAVVAALCARALPGRVLGLLMPERDSSPDALRLGRAAADAAGVETIVEDVGPALDALGCYTRQLQAIRTVFPDYGEGWRCKLSLPPLLESDRLNVFQLTVQAPGQEPLSSRMPAAAYLALVAATNMKQRVRKLVEYTHADRLSYSVAGTPNRLEYALGFFVKNGDGAADIKPIAHLYKSQVYALAAHLGVPEEIRQRPPTTDTWSLAQTQEEFFFALPWNVLDVCLWGADRGIPATEIASAAGLSADQVDRVYRDIASKIRATRYLHTAPLLVASGEDDVPAQERPVAPARPL